MTPTERENLRLSLLRFLGNNPTGYGVPETMLLALAKTEGRRGLLADELRAELVYLVDRHLVDRVPKTISPEVAQWRITADGRDFLAERGIE